MDIWIKFQTDTKRTTHDLTMFHDRTYFVLPDRHVGARLGVQRRNELRRMSLGQEERYSHRISLSRQEADRLEADRTSRAELDALSGLHAAGSTALQTGRPVRDETVHARFPDAHVEAPGDRPLEPRVRVQPVRHHGMPPLLEEMFERVAGSRAMRNG